MRIYEARLVYEATLFEVGTAALTAPDRVYAYMKDVLDAHPMQEVFYVILLNQKNKPLVTDALSLCNGDFLTLRRREDTR